MRKAALAAFVVSAICFTADPVEAAPSWVRVETPNFVVFGEVGERRTADIAMEFERFREALLRMFPRSGRARVPTLVFIFGSRKSYEPFLPRHRGKAVEFAGYFSAGEEQNLITMIVQGRENNLQTVFHEYAHLVVMNATDRVPAWLNEGLAEFYSTFEVIDGGRGATVGAPIRHHMQLVHGTALLTIEELLNVDSTASMDDGDRRTLFYAQSWALVHMLMTQEPSRSRDIEQYLGLLMSGTDSLAAWRRVFGDLDVAREVKRHVRQDALRGFATRFASELPKVQGTKERVPVSEVNAALAAFGASTPDRPPPAASDSDTALTRALVGLIGARNGLSESDRHLLVRAATEGDDWLARYFAACGLARALDQVSPGESSPLSPPALAAADAVLAARPELPHALSIKARALLATPDGVEGAARAIGAARALAPRYPTYAFIAYTVHMRREDYPAARTAIGPFLSSATRPHVRDHARSLMTIAVRAERETNRNPVAKPAAAGEAAAADTAAPPAAFEERAETTVHIYRELQEGERQVEGTLEKIGCTADATTLHVAVYGQRLQFVGGRIDTIDFITYRPDLSGEVRCAPRVPPDRVRVTFVATQVKGSSGFPVAVEFLPAAVPLR